MYRITAMDLQERLILMLGGKADEDSVTDIRTAIRQAMRLVSAEHAWPYYHDYMHLNTVESVDEGTIVYTASTRTVVLTGSTWPTWINQGSIIIDTLHARVDNVIDSTTLTVKSDDAPVEDYSGTYTLYQYQFTLDTDYNIHKIGKLQVDQANWLEYVPASLFETDIRRQYLTTGGRPRWFTISRDWRNTGQNVMSLWPYPTTVLRCRFGYFRHPRDIRTWDYQIGQVATTASSTAVTGTDTVWASRHAGCLLRTYSDQINSPTSMDGRFPPVDEAVVQSVTSATALVTATALTATQSDVSYTLSDIIDCDNTAMYEAVAYCARNELAKLRRVDPKLQALYQIDYNNALYSAKAQANPSDSVRIAGSFGRSNIGFPGLWSSYYVLS